MIVFDLDGTLALNEHRQHFVDKTPGQKDWPAFFDACDLDVPNHELIRVLYSLRQSGRTVEIWSGRVAAVRNKTEDWLFQVGLHDLELKMRPVDDHQSDVDLKRGWYHAAPVKPVLCFDDRDKVVKMWRELGVVCCQVAPGDF